MNTITLQRLLKVMNMETFRTLKARGRIKINRGAPHTLIMADSLPNRFQEALSRPSIP